MNAVRSLQWGNGSRRCILIDYEEQVGIFQDQLLEIREALDSARLSLIESSYADVIRSIIECKKFLRERYSGQLELGVPEYLETLKTLEKSIAGEIKQLYGIPPEPPSDKLPPQAKPISDRLRERAHPIFDYTRLREDPVCADFLREYSDNTIIVSSSRDMTDTVKPDFATRAWIYAADHYGDGSVAINTVVDRRDNVVEPALVLDALNQLGVPYKIHRRKPKRTASEEKGQEPGFASLSDEMADAARRSEYSTKTIILSSCGAMTVPAKQEFVLRGWSYAGKHFGNGPVRIDCVWDRDGKFVPVVDVEAVLTDRNVPFSIHHTAPERTAPAVEQEAEGKELSPEREGDSPGDSPGSQYDATGALRLEEGQELHITGVCDHATDKVELRFEIGHNVISVVATYKQAMAFLVEATVITTELMAEKGRILATDMQRCGSISEADHKSKAEEATGKETE